MPITPAQAKNTQTGVLSESGLTSDQATFAVDLSQDTGLDPNVIGAWELSEESGSAAQSYQSEGFEDWLNIGGPGAAAGKSFAGFHQGPEVAAADTAAWIKGTLSIPGFGKDVAAEQKIVSAAGTANPQASIAAINSSGWAGPSGYPSLQSLYTKLSGDKTPLASVATAITDPLTGAATVASSIPNAISAGAQEASGIWSAITNPQNWLRALEILGAVIAIYLAMKSLTGADPAAVIEKGAAVAAVA